MRFALAATVIACITAGGVGAQQAATEPAFEAVSIKRSPPDAPPGVAGPRPGGRYAMVNGPARVLILTAYPTPTNELVGAPDWVTNENYDVNATAGRDVPYEELRAMVRTMLRDRFKLVARQETRERPVYELVLARADRALGPRLRRTQVDCATIRITVPVNGVPTSPCTSASSLGRIISTGVSMRALASNLSRPSGRVVLDRTGLEGGFEFTLEFAPEPVGGGDAAGATGASLFAALQEQLGLKLEPAQAPLPAVVIDRIERPTPD